MGTILIRYAELGLKSDKVRARFLRHLIDHISKRLLDDGIEHLMNTERGRVFLETDQVEETSESLRLIPGIYSFSEVTVVPNDMEGLMDGMAEYSLRRLKEGMSFGIKVRRTGETEYTSRDIAIAGGDAVCRHLDDSKVKVDLKDPDIWFEVEIRGRNAYLFTERIRGIGGMPSNTQGKIILLLPPRDDLEGPREETASRAFLTRAMMLRRGCRVIPVIYEKDLGSWEDILGDLKEEGRDPFILRGDTIETALSDALRKTGAMGIAYPGSEEDIGKVPFVHGKGISAAVFMPTVAMDMKEVNDWMTRFK